MHAQVLQVAVRDHGAHDIGQRANAQLDGGTVLEQLHHVLGDAHVGLAGLGFGQLHQRRVGALDHHVDFGNVDALVTATQAARHRGVDFQNRLLRLAQIIRRHRAAGREVEETVGIHGSDLGHRHVRALVQAHCLRALVGGEGNVACQAALGVLAAQTGEVPVVPDEGFPGRISLDAGQRLQARGGDQVHILQFAAACGQRRVECLDVLRELADKHRVARLHHCSGHFGGDMLLLIQILLVHSHGQLLHYN